MEAVWAQPGRPAQVGGMDIVRVLPTRGRRTIGAWCFVDLMSPDSAAEPDPMEVGPHPHIGLSTVTWLLTGEAVHTDSLGTEQLIQPGQLNLMTAGRGIAHAEQAFARGPFRGVQLWVAQPAGTREGEPAFEHHGELPQADVDGGHATVMVGELGGAASPARSDTPMLGADLIVEAGGHTLELDRGFEHALVPLDGAVVVDGVGAELGELLVVPEGRDELRVELPDAGRFLLLGGEPFGERIQMWWNFVARDRDELEAAWRSWRDRDDRFGDVPSALDRIDAPRPMWLPEPA